MALFRYTARYSLVAGHAVGQLCTLDTDLSRATRSRVVDKSQPVATDGAFETIYRRADTKWALDFAPTHGDQLGRLTEMLDSTGSGEVFEVWLYPSAPAPTRVVRDDDGYTLSRSIPTGQRRSDAYRPSIVVLER